MPTVYLLDYVAGNVRSLVNAIEKLGWTVEWIRSPADVAKADVSNPLSTTLYTTLVFEMCS
jgi:imidazoleglycerol phosphate synthase glutamine amidotransferase subunit HisH